MYVNQSKDLYDRTTSEYIVAYLDILGISERMKKSNAQQLLDMNKLHNLYTFSVDWTRKTAMDGNKDIIFKIFSDNIIIAKKLPSTPIERKQAIKVLLYCASHFQELAASDSVGWLIRGGISIGELFIDDVMVWGEALINAYKLESNIAIYPRVVIDSKIVSTILCFNEISDFVRRDFDDVYFLNYLSICHFCGELLMNGFYIMQEELNGVISPKIRQKLSWHMNYINNELDYKNEKKDLKYRLHYL